MKAHLVRRGVTPPDTLAGMILARDVRDGDGRRAFPKGHVVKGDELAALLALEWDELHVIEPEPGEIHEDEAGRRIADAAAGDGTAVGDVAGGHWPIAATRRGLLHVEVGRLAKVNAIEGACAYTLYDGQVVDAGEVVARAKITPFVIDRQRIEKVERIARDTRGLVSVRAFAPTDVAAVVQETLGAGAMERFRAALDEKVRWFGSRLMEPRFVPPSGEAVASAIQGVIADAARLVVIAGTKSLDPLDPAFVGLERLGIRIERFGVPAHPGSLFWIAHVGEVPVLGMPSCGLFSQATVFDLVLPRVLAGERVGRHELGALGHGGLLTRDLAFRFPRYRQTAQGRGEIA